MRAKIILLMWLYERRRRVVPGRYVWLWEQFFISTSFILLSLWLQVSAFLLYCLPHAIKKRIILRLFQKLNFFFFEPQSDFFFHYEFLHAIIVSPAHFEINMRHPIVLNKLFLFSFPRHTFTFDIAVYLLLHMCDVSCKFHILNFFDILNW